MKKYIAMLLALCMTLSLCGCADSGNNGAPTEQRIYDREKEVSFVAKILEVYDGSVLVQPVEGSSELRSADQISFGTKNLEPMDVTAGDWVEIFYDGQIMESYPAQIIASRWKRADQVQTTETTETETTPKERTAYSGEPWIDKETAIQIEEFYSGDLVISEIYTDCFIAYPLIPLPQQYKINGTLSEDWCVGDQVVCTCENIWQDQNSSHIEADLLTVEVGTMELDPMVAYKPVIYLYPQEETEVSVKLSLNGELLCTYPAYGEGWQVAAAPDGTLTDSRGQTYSYLYWEGALQTCWDLSEGFCVKGEDTALFLETALQQLGLNRREANEFIVYWLPLMEQNPYNIIAFQTEAYTDAAELNIDPAPDTLIRIFMTWQAAESYVNLPPQELTAPSRTGFTAVEWGGTEVK